MCCRMLLVELKVMVKSRNFTDEMGLVELFLVEIDFVDIHFEETWKSNLVGDSLIWFSIIGMTDTLK